MPKTVFDKYRPKQTPNYLSAYLDCCKKNKGYTNDDIADILKSSRATVQRRLRQSPELWTLGTLKKYCEVLGADYRQARLLAGGDLQ